jgi:hypothetical protein
MLWLIFLDLSFRHPEASLTQLVCLSTLVIVSEAFVLQQMGWGKFGRSLLDSLLMNGASTLGGYVTWWLGLSLVLKTLRLAIGESHAVYWLLIVILLFIALSTLMEVGVLSVFRFPLKGVTTGVLMANIVSYMLSVIAAPLLIWLTQDLIHS